MRFIIGYFGSDPSYAQKIQQTAHKNSIESALSSQLDTHFALYTGIYKRQTQELDAALSLGHNSGALIRSYSPEKHMRQ